MNQVSNAVRLDPFFINFKRPSPHSTFSPSAAERWLITACPFSINFCKGIPEEQTDYSIEGTFAHSYCEALFYNKYYGLQISPKLLNDINMWMLEDPEKRGGALIEMDRCAHDYVNIITDWLNDRERIGDVIYFGLEQSVPIFPDEGCFGTADVLIVGTKGSVLIDYKYGKGKNVKADTVQLKVYGAGIARFLQNVPGNYPVHIVIHQPRVDPFPKYHSYSRDELYCFLQVIWDSIQASKRKDLQPVEGNHCFWCPGRRTKDQNLKCPAILDKPMKVARENFAGFLADMNMPVESIVAANPTRDNAIAKLHALYPLIKQIVEDTSEEIKMRLQKGEPVHGFFLKDDLGNRAINAENDAQKAQLIQYHFPGINPWKVVPQETKLKTITELEKEAGKNKLDPICVRKITKKVELLDDRMKAILGELGTFAQMINNGQEE